MFIHVNDQAILLNHGSNSPALVHVEGFESLGSGVWCKIINAGKSTRCRLGMLQRAQELDQLVIGEIHGLLKLAESLTGLSGHDRILISSLIWCLKFELTDSAKVPQDLKISPVDLIPALCNTLSDSKLQEFRNLLSNDEASLYPLYIHLFCYDNALAIIECICNRKRIL